jgi:hypothetical protein
MVGCHCNAPGPLSLGPYPQAPKSLGPYPQAPKSPKGDFYAFGLLTTTVSKINPIPWCRLNVTPNGFVLRLYYKSPLGDLGA